MSARPQGPPESTHALGWADVVVFLALVGLLATVAWLGRDLWAPVAAAGAAPLDLSPWRLPYYAVRSLLRMFVALGASVLFTCVVASIAARSRPAAAVILPALDVLQSVPVLGFLSATVTFFMAMAPGRVLGLELASIFAIFTSQVWNLTFAFHQALVTLPREQAEAVRLYRLSAWQRFSHFELPAAMIPLVWNGMMSFGGGWFFLAASEAITVLGREWVLPGIGSYVAVAVTQQDTRALGWAFLTMAVVIVAVDRVFWRPLVAWSEKFKLEESRASVAQRSAVLDFLRRTRLVPGLEAWLARADEAIDRVTRHADHLPLPPAAGNRARVPGLVGLLVVWAVLGALAVRGSIFIATEVAGSEVLRVVGLGALTFLRVVAVVAVATLVWTPIGVWIGLSPRVAQVVQPVVQILAAFPANLLFPGVTLLFLRFHLSLEWGGALLMALGAQWYVLFNTIAGALAIPNDLREMARNLGVRGRAWWQTLVLPAILPAWVTGALTAAGGAWNASVVAEVVSWGNARLIATGLGSYITNATSVGDWPRIVLGVSVMSAYVVALNHAVWRPLARLAESRYRLG